MTSCTVRYIRIQRFIPHLFFAVLCVCSCVFKCIYNYCSFKYLLLFSVPFALNIKPKPHATVVRGGAWITGILFYSSIHQFKRNEDSQFNSIIVRAAHLNYFQTIINWRHSHEQKNQPDKSNEKLPRRLTDGQLPNAHFVIWTKFCVKSPPFPFAATLIEMCGFHSMGYLNKFNEPTLETWILSHLYNCTVINTSVQHKSNKKRFLFVFKAKNFS